MDKVSFPSGLCIIYDVNTERTGFRPDRENRHTYMHQQA